MSETTPTPAPAGDAAPPAERPEPAAKPVEPEPILQFTSQELSSLRNLLLREKRKALSDFNGQKARLASLESSYDKLIAYLEERDAARRADAAE